jgi:hypothetical protein
MLLVLAWMRTVRLRARQRLLAREWSLAATASMPSAAVVMAAFALRESRLALLVRRGLLLLRRGRSYHGADDLCCASGCGFVRQAVGIGRRRESGSCRLGRARRRGHRPR